MIETMQCIDDYYLIKTKMDMAWIGESATVWGRSWHKTNACVIYMHTYSMSMVKLFGIFLKSIFLDFSPNIFSQITRNNYTKCNLFIVKNKFFGINVDQSYKMKYFVECFFICAYFNMKYKLTAILKCKLMNLKIIYILYLLYQILIDYK